MDHDAVLNRRFWRYGAGEHFGAMAIFVGQGLACEHHGAGRGNFYAEPVDAQVAIGEQDLLDLARQL